MASVSTQKVEVRYLCSKCGAPNTAQTTILAEGFTQENIAANMSEKLEKLDTDFIMQNGFPGHLSCKCKKCGYSEPWAKENYARPGMPLIIGTIVVSIIGMAIMRESSLVSIVMYLLIGLAWVFYFISVQQTKKKIAAISPEAMPKCELIRKPHAPNPLYVKARADHNTNNK